MYDTNTTQITTLSGLSLPNFPLDVGLTYRDMKGSRSAVQDCCNVLLKSQDRKSNTRTGSYDLGDDIFVSFFAHSSNTLDRTRRQYRKIERRVSLAQGDHCSLRKTLCDKRDPTNYTKSVSWTSFWLVAKHGQSRIPTSLSWRHFTTDALHPCAAWPFDTAGCM